MYILYSIELKRVIFVGVILLSLVIIFTGKSFAAISGAKSTITTSRPSPSSPNNDTLPGAAASSTQLTIYNNGSRFLASDSAKVIRTSTTNIINQNLVVSTQSAGLTTVFLGNSTSALTQNGTDVVYVPITAMHTIQLTIGTEIPDEGDLEIIFPTLATGDADNDASPSATTFQFNNLVSGTGGRDNIRVLDDGTSLGSDFTVTETEPSPGSPGRISIEFDNGPIAAGSVITVHLGCTALSGSNCSTQAPRIINPTKTATLGADSWKVTLTTENASDGLLETATVGIATIESVTVRATVDPTLSFTITGINSGADLATGNTGCSIAASKDANSGINSTANEVNLGIIQNTPAAGGAIPNLAGQYITISTNGATGYTLTATSASSLLNPETGYYFLTSTTPTNFLGNSDFFGLHPCGNDVNNTWVEGNPGGGSDCSFVSGAHGGTGDECFWAWPNATATLGSGVTLTLATDTVGPVGSGTGETGDGITSIAYGAGIDVLVPPGEYRSIITYIATPGF